MCVCVCVRVCVCVCVKGGENFLIELVSLNVHVESLDDTG